MKINTNGLRKHILEMVYKKQSGHIGGSFSICELVAYLYSNYDFRTKDKLILSKGHAVPAIYAALYELGHIDNFNDFREINSPLQGHPVKGTLDTIQATTGSLGQGLSIAIGHALAMRLEKSDGHVFCICGDGEMQEGQFWEALMFASKQNLNNLTLLIDYNGFQSEGEVERMMPIRTLGQKLRSFGWLTGELAGHKMSDIHNALTSEKSNSPNCWICWTTKGKGVSFMENNPSWHAGLPSEEQYQSALMELNSKI